MAYVPQELKLQVKDTISVTPERWAGTEQHVPTAIGSS